MLRIERRGRRGRGETRGGGGRRVNAKGGRIRRFEEDPKRREDWEFVKKWEEGRKGRIGTRRGGEGCDRWEEGKEGEAG